ncbi:hypothetical protein GRI72_02795 [Altererythrobacter marinus]|uniref:Uncharacterized protein n=1 Tax=Pelagerythrobacter marinus TaxID=538382 RepID=A0ABW9UVZ1_9SPHN|nr:hypothetical protein [Pelagerythrobacter marinus]MXO67760.1 hypothetical protein [Pelagerythrobacter marinus]
MSDNPPAFPCVHDKHLQEGMTLRDWFAGQALTVTAKIPHQHGMSIVQVGSPMHPEKAASAAYRFADALLSEREKNHG